MTPALREEVGRALGSRVTGVKRLHGGDINQAFRAELEDGRVACIKYNDAAPPDMFAREAEGLAWLAGSLRLPEVLAHGERFLALEYLEPGPPCRDFEARLGQGLAALHRRSAARFGTLRDNYIGRLPQSNRAHDDWASFYGAERLAPQLRLASGVATPALVREVERVITALPSLVGPAEPPARLHGDLWGGNLHRDAAGEPVLIDPAAYAGHREVDLAMMRLFGGFSARVFDAYAEAYPLAPGHEARVPLYQLYFLLAHVNLFGRGYVDSATAAAARCR